MDQGALELLVKHPAQAARWCGLTRLTDELHGPWLREMIAGQDDMTLLAHRGSYKTTCLAFAMAVMLVIYPKRNLIFMRKTDDDVVEIIRQVKLILQSDAMQHLTSRIYGSPVQLLKSDMFTVNTDCYAALRGAAQLLGLGTSGSLTGKHADVVLTDDIVNLNDRLSAAERRRIRGVYQELQNIRNPGGRIINTGTPWHPEDAISLMPNIRRCDCYHTGLLSEEKVLSLRRSMTPSLFAANYELRHIASEGALFATAPDCDAETSLLRDGVAHLDAAYGGEDFTALTLGRMVNGRIVLYGRLWRRHVDTLMEEIAGVCDQFLCGPVWCETNGDKGYVARELRKHGASVRTYAEHTSKHVKISTWLHKWWPRITFAKGTDRAYIDQILDYTQDASHDDAPDSAACLLRILDRNA